MTFNKKYILVFQCYILLFGLLFSNTTAAQDTRFTVVIDAGHGGHDPGAMGAFSREKDINLSVSLQLGAIIEQKYQDVKVVFTRKTDRYLTLQERADVVNSNHADLFICIHTNSAESSSAFGAESFTLGLAKTKANLDVAMRENSVITLEDNYKTKYRGFDPNSVDSYIMFEFMQDKYIDRSVEFASKIQKQFRYYCNRSDRGVRQAGFWVLHRSACPSVLVEVGFISNPAEERYLSAKEGQAEMATGIFNAFVDYKRDHDKKSGRQTAYVSKIEQKERQSDVPKAEASPEVNDNADTQIKPQSTVQTKSLPKSGSEIEMPKQSKAVDTLPAKKVDLTTVFKQNEQLPSKNGSILPVFKVQLLASNKNLKLNSSEFKSVKNISFFKEGGFYKYTIGEDTDYSKIERIRTEILSKFPEAFIIAFLNDKKMTAKEALKLVKK